MYSCNHLDTLKPDFLQMPEDIFDDIIISQLMEYMIAFIVAKDWIIGEALLGV